jgi:hypothetical protein
MKLYREVEAYKGIFELVTRRYKMYYLFSNFSRDSWCRWPRLKASALKWHDQNFTYEWSLTGNETNVRLNAVQKLYRRFQLHKECRICFNNVSCICRCFTRIVVLYIDIKQYRVSFSIYTQNSALLTKFRLWAVLWINGSNNIICFLNLR